jgi:hypothetical protein
VYQKHREKQVTKANVPSIYDDAFKKIDTEYLPSQGASRNNSILSLVREAKMKSAEFLEEKAARDAAVKAARAKYGFR